MNAEAGGGIQRSIGDQRDEGLGTRDWGLGVAHPNPQSLIPNPQREAR